MCLFLSEEMFDFFAGGEGGMAFFFQAVAVQK